MDMFAVMMAITILFGIVVTLLIRQYWHASDTVDTFEFPKNEDGSKGHNEYITFTMNGKLKVEPKD